MHDVMYPWIKKIHSFARTSQRMPLPNVIVDFVATDTKVPLYIRAVEIIDALNWQVNAGMA